MLEGFLKGLDQPEYIHVLINPLPVYGLAMGLVALMIGLVLRSREARTGALALILIAAASAWPVLHYGQQGYDSVKGMADSEGEKWLEEHKRRARAGINRRGMEAAESHAPVCNHDIGAGHGRARHRRLHRLRWRTHPAQRVPLRACARTTHRGASRALTKILRMLWRDSSG